MIALLVAAALQVGVDYSLANHQGCGNYTDCGYPASFSMSSPGLSLGLTGRSWRAGVEYLGRVSSDAQAVDDGSYVPGGCRPNSVCYHHRMQTSQETAGLYASWLPTWALGDWRAGFELGLWLHHDAMTMMQIPGPGVGPGCTSHPTRPGVLGGLILRRGRWELGLSDRSNSANDVCPLLTRNGTATLSLRYSL